LDFRTFDNKSQLYVYRDDKEGYVQIDISAGGCVASIAEVKQAGKTVELLGFIASMLSPLAFTHEDNKEQSTLKEH